MIGNRVTEKEVRGWLDQNGYFGRSAVFYELELEAIQRPGWIQVFRFFVKAKTREGEWVDLFGVVRDDERERGRERQTRVAVFELESDRDGLMSEWSQDLIRRRSEPMNGTTLILAFIILFLAAVAGLGFWFG